MGAGESAKDTLLLVLERVLKIAAFLQVTMMSDIPRKVDEKRQSSNITK